MTFDPRTEANIKTLHPKAQGLARVFMAAAIPILKNYGADIKIISGTRTWEEQDKLYAKGRTAPGPRVTNARGGYSNHNFGIAFDVGIFVHGKYLEDSALYAVVGKLGKSLGLEWGGDWKTFRDEPHFQLKTGLTIAQMRQCVLEKKDILT